MYLNVQLIHGKKMFICLHIPNGNFTLLLEIF